MRQGECHEFKASLGYNERAWLKKRKKGVIFYLLWLAWDGGFSNFHGRLGEENSEFYELLWRRVENWEAEESGEGLYFRGLSVFKLKYSAWQSAIIFGSLFWVPVRRNCVKWWCSLSFAHHEHVWLKGCVWVRPVCHFCRYNPVYPNRTLVTLADGKTIQNILEKCLQLLFRKGIPEIYINY